MPVIRQSSGGMGAASTEFQIGSRSWGMFGHARFLNSKYEQENQIIHIRPGWPRFEQIVQSGKKGI